MPKWLLISICIVVTVLIAGVVVRSPATVKINLNEYVIFTTSGYDGYGYIKAEIDWNKVEKDHGENLKFDSAAMIIIGPLADIITPIDQMKQTHVRLEKTSLLSNGDEIPYTFYISEPFNPANPRKPLSNHKFLYENGVYVVSGLVEPEPFDPFEDMEVFFTGTSPNGKAWIKYNGTELPYGSSGFLFNKVDGLKNGDKVTVTINKSWMAFTVEELGKAPITLKKEYIVSGLKEA
jgi:hypothetical protein